MSIIQEALKKVQKEIVLEQPSPKVATEEEWHREASQETPEIEKKHPLRINLALSIPLFIILITLLIIIVKTSLPKASKPVTVKAADMPKAEAKLDAALSQQKGMLPILPFKPQYKDLTLNGIMDLEDGPRAIINNSIVGEGDAVNGATVIRIDKSRVVLKANDADIILDLK